MTIETKPAGAYRWCFQPLYWINSGQKNLVANKENINEYHRKLTHEAKEPVYFAKQNPLSLAGFASVFAGPLSFLSGLLLDNGSLKNFGISLSGLGTLLLIVGKVFGFKPDTDSSNLENPSLCNRQILYFSPGTIATTVNPVTEDTLPEVEVFQETNVSLPVIAEAERILIVANPIEEVVGIATEVRVENEDDFFCLTEVTEAGMEALGITDPLELGPGVVLLKGPVRSKEPVPVSSGNTVVDISDSSASTNIADYNFDSDASMPEVTENPLNVYDYRLLRAFTGPSEVVGQFAPFGFLKAGDCYPVGEKITFVDINYNDDQIRRLLDATYLRTVMNETTDNSELQFLRALCEVLDLEIPLDSRPVKFKKIFSKNPYDFVRISSFIKNEEHLEEDANSWHKAIVARLIMRARISSWGTDGNVTVETNYIPGKGVHAWVRYVNRDGEKIICDPTLNYVGPADSRDAPWDYVCPRFARNNEGEILSSNSTVWDIDLLCAKRIQLMYLKDHASGIDWNEDYHMIDGEMKETEFKKWFDCLFVVLETSNIPEIRKHAEEVLKSKKVKFTPSVKTFLMDYLSDPDVGQTRVETVQFVLDTLSKQSRNSSLLTYPLFLLRAAVGTTVGK